MLVENNASASQNALFNWKLFFARQISRFSRRKAFSPQFDVHISI